MIARLEQGQKRRGDRRHARRETHRARTLLHLRDFGLQRCGRRRALTCVVVAAFHGALKHADQVFYTLVAVLNRGMNRLVNAAVFYAKVLVGVDVFCGESSGVCHILFSFRRHLSKLRLTAALINHRKDISMPARLGSYSVVLFFNFFFGGVLTGACV